MNSKPEEIIIEITTPETIALHNWLFGFLKIKNSAFEDPSEECILVYLNMMLKEKLKGFPLDDTEEKFKVDETNSKRGPSAPVPTQLRFNEDEALVLFEWLSNFNALPENNSFDECSEINPEQQILWVLECLFEKVLVPPFQSNYDTLLEKARSKIRDKMRERL